MQKVNSVLLLVFVILVIACFLMGCVEKSAPATGRSASKIDWNTAERTDMFSLIGYQQIGGDNLAVFHYDDGNVTIFVTSDGLAAVPDYQLNRAKDYSTVQEALDLTKVKS